MVGFSSVGTPLAHPVLYLRYGCHEANPLVISGRTSNHEVCLAFHPYPQLIRAFCNKQQFRPPPPVTADSPWPWVDHFASGLEHATNSPYSDSLSLRLRLSALTLLRKITRRLIKQKARDQAFPCGHSPFAACRCTVSGSISLPSPGFFSPFPHGTGALSVISEYLALERGRPGFPLGYSSPVVLRTSIQQARVVSRTGLSPSLVNLSRLFRYDPGF